MTLLTCTEAAGCKLLPKCCMCYQIDEDVFLCLFICMCFLMLQCVQLSEPLQVGEIIILLYYAPFKYSSKTHVASFLAPHCH